MTFKDTMRALNGDSYKQKGKLNKGISKAGFKMGNIHLGYFFIFC